MEQGMKESHTEGVANRRGPASCVLGEDEVSLTAGEGASWVLSSESIESGLPVTLLGTVGETRRPEEPRGRERTGGVVDPTRARTLHVREPGEPGKRPRGKRAGRERPVAYTPDANAAGQSDSGIVPTNPPNNARQPAAEEGEGRPLTKGNPGRLTTGQTQDWEDVSYKLDWIREAARKDRRKSFTTLLHHVTPRLLLDSFGALRRDAASGVDEMTCEQYEEGLGERLLDLHDRVHSGGYRAQPSKRIYIEKEDGRKRPIGIAALEDKIVQQAVKRVLEAIYEEDFLGFSYGFRPGRNQHRALDAVWVGLKRRRVNWVVDADIRGFFDALDHGWLLKFLEHRVSDDRILRLVRKWLRAGVSEDGRWSETTVGTPQGAVISPLLANLFLHYALDQWVEQWRKRYATGDVIIVRYADDFVMGFQHEKEARRFLVELRERLEKFHLELHPEKTRLIEFGRYAERDHQARGQGKPETFDFLGFTHWCGKTRKSGKFIVGRKPVAKRVRKKLKQIRETLLRRRHESVAEQGAWLRSVVQGYFAYFAVPGTSEILSAFRKHVSRFWLRALRRRSQKGRGLTWKRIERLLDTWIPKVKIVHPYPDQRLIV